MEGYRWYLRTWADDFVVVEYMDRSTHENTLKGSAEDITAHGLLGGYDSATCIT